MTQPRFVLAGDTVMVTRRTLRRHHLFRPDPAIRQLYLYALAVCAKQFATTPPRLASADTCDGIRQFGSGKDLKSLAATLARFVRTEHT